MENPNLDENGVEEPQTPKETEGEITPKNPSEGESVPPEEVDYKKKFSESTAENQRIIEEDKKKAEKIAELERTLSEKELNKNPEYELMTDEEKEQYKERQRIAKDVAILKAKEQMREDYGALPEEVRKKLEKKGGYDVFRDYACLPENAGQKNLLNLAKSFLYEEREEPEEPKEKPGLERQSGGERTAPPKKEGFTAEEVKQIRENDPDRYVKLAKAGKLKIIK